MRRTGRTGDRSVTGLLVQAPIRSDPSGRCASRRCTGSGRQIERRTPWSYLGRGQTGPVQHQGQVFTDLAVGLRPVGPSLLRCDPEFSASVTPEIRLVAAAVVGEHSLDGDTAVGEPGDR